MRVGINTAELALTEEELPHTVRPSHPCRRVEVLGLVFVGAIASAWALSGPGQRTSVSSGDFEGLVGLSDAQKAGVLTVCTATRQVLSMGGKYSQKYDIGSGTGTRSFPCPFGATNREGEVTFECSASGIWRFGRHNCYHCEGKQLTLNMGDTISREVDLPFGSQGDERSEPCEFQDNGEKIGGTKTYEHGNILFSCGASRQWELARMSCSDRKCADAKVDIRTPDSLIHTLNLEVHGDNEDKAEVACPGEGDGPKMQFECVAKDSLSATTQYGWAVTDTPCKDLKYPQNDNWCAARTAKVHVKKNWDGALDKDVTVKLNPAFKGIHSYPCPAGWPNAGSTDGTGGKIEFECAHGTWALKYIDCTGDEMVGQKSA